MSDQTAELLDRLRAARAERRGLAICGARSKPWMARAAALSTAGHRGIVAYDPAELVVTVRSGTPLAELDAALAENGQMLAMEAPDFNGASTIGGAVALGWAGSRSAFAGGVRDAVLGVRMANGLGEDLRFGGRVMKNVAGFDISRLMVGSCGRLGLLLELSLKVVPRPEQEITLAWAHPDLESTLGRVDALTRRRFPVTGASFEAGRLRLRLSGSGSLLAGLARELDGEEEDGRYWRQLQTLALPLFHHGWGDEKLFDANGAICWTAHSRRSGGAAVALSRGPDLSAAANAPILQRVVEAFDPEGLFRGNGRDAA